MARRTSGARVWLAIIPPVFALAVLLACGGGSSVVVPHVTLIQRTATQSLTAGGATQRVTAACNAGEKVVSGGYGFAGTADGDAVLGSYPSNSTGNPATSSPTVWTVPTGWTVVFDNQSSTRPATVFVNCLTINLATSQQIANSAFSITATNTPTMSFSRRPTQTRVVSASCPAGYAVTGGGFLLDHGGPPDVQGAVYASMPSATGWSMKATRFGDASSPPLNASVYAVCLTQFTAAPARHVTLSFTADQLACPLDGSSPCTSQGHMSARCPSGQVTTGGGFDASAFLPAGDELLVTRNSAQADFSQWDIQMVTQSGALIASPAGTAIDVPVWATCVVAPH